MNWLKKQNKIGWQNKINGLTNQTKWGDKHMKQKNGLTNKTKLGDKKRKQKFETS